MKNYIKEREPAGLTGSGRRWNITLNKLPIKTAWVVVCCLMLLNCTPQLKTGTADKAESIVQNEHLIENLLKSRPEHFAAIMRKKDKYQVQIIYTQINRDSANVPSFRSFYYNVDPERYFYPASTVKMPAAFLALEKLNELNIDGLERNTVMLTDSAFSGQSRVMKDTTAKNGMPSIAHYLKKIFLVSDNDAFNRIYEFIGQQELNQKLAEKGYDDSRIITRLAIFLTEEENRHTNPVRFLAGDSIIYEQSLVYNSDKLPLKGQVLKGKGYMKNGQFIPEPMDFTLKNFIPLEEMQMMLRAVLFPEYTDTKHTFNLTEEDYRFVYQYMSQLPSETTWPRYDTAEYYEGYSKLLMYGNSKEPLPKHIRIFNKYGQSYGYLIDNAYIIDLENNVEFMLSAVIQANEDQIYNDNRYEYDQIGFPFMQNLGQLIYQYELKRKRAYNPELTKFMVGYDKVVKISNELHPNLFMNYRHYHIPSLDHRRIKTSDIKPFIEALKTTQGFEVTKAGESVEGRTINMVKVGRGPTKVLLWSQMHGDESTATRALFEIFDFLAANDALNSFRNLILENTTLYFLPMLNPDGAENFERRNALSIDINRDALRLTSPEARILKTARDIHEPEFGFNLHDQSKHYNVYRTGKTASISFLAPAYNHAKEVNEGRAESMKLIVSMNKVLQQYIPGQVARYDDTFEPRAFGDNIQKWGTNTVLIESGGNAGDPEKKELVKMNFIAILHALYQIATDGSYKQESLNDYSQIPDNDRKFFDLLIRNGQVRRNNGVWKMDIGVYNQERAGNAGLFHKSRISDLGDLSTYYGYKELNAEGMVISAGEIYPEVLHTTDSLTPEQACNWLRQGYTTVRVQELPPEDRLALLPLNVVPVHQTQLADPDLGQEANLIVSKDDTVIYAVINGRVIAINECITGEKFPDFRFK